MTPVGLRSVRAGLCASALFAAIFVFMGCGGSDSQSDSGAIDVWADDQATALLTGGAEGRPEPLRIRSAGTSSLVKDFNGGGQPPSHLLVEGP